MNSEEGLGKPSYIGFTKGMCETKETLSRRRQKEISKAVLEKWQRENDKESTCRTLFDGTKDQAS